MLGNFIKAHKRATIIGSLIIAALIGLIIYTALVRTGKEPVAIYLIPSDTKLLINGEQHSEGTAYLKKGRYTIEATRNGFRSEKREIDIVSPNTLTIDIALRPASNEAAKWAEENVDLYNKYDGRAGVRAQQEGETFSTVNPITSKLPYENLMYTIGYRADPSDASDNGIIVEIDAQRGYRNAAIDKIRSLGFDPTDYKITFRDYESPFSHE